MAILQKQDIVSIVEQTLSRGTELNTIVNQKIDYILSQLYIDYTWEFLSKEPPVSGTFTAGSSLWTLPADYLKFKYMATVRTDINATQPPHIPIDWIPQSQFEMIRVPNRQGAPMVVTTNGIATLNSAVGIQGYVYPTPDQNYSYRLSYYFNPTYTLNSTDVPSFPDQHTLIELIVNEMLGAGYAAHGRVFDQNLMEKTVARYRRNMADTGIYPNTARLDTRLHKPRQARYVTWPQDVGQ